MANSFFNRQLNSKLLADFLLEPLYINHLSKDISSGHVFPAIRNDRIDFYYAGGKLFHFDKDGFHTHIKYASVVDLNGNTNNYFTEKELGLTKLITKFDQHYERIKENCKMYASIEAKGVSQLYKKYSYASSNSPVVLLDIEASFASLRPGKVSDRIDLVSYDLKKRTLKFFEVKHYSNSEIWSKTNAKVIDQVLAYENQISAKKVQILNAYTEYVNIVNQLFNSSTPIPTPIDITTKVPLLIFGFDSDQLKGRLSTLVLKNPAYDNKNIIRKAYGSMSSVRL